MCRICNLIIKYVVLFIQILISCVSDVLDVLYIFRDSCEGRKAHK